MSRRFEAARRRALRTGSILLALALGAITAVQVDPGNAAGAAIPPLTLKTSTPPALAVGPVTVTTPNVQVPAITVTTPSVSVPSKTVTTPGLSTPTPITTTRTTVTTSAVTVPPATATTSQVRSGPSPAPSGPSVAAPATPTRQHTGGPATAATRTVPKPVLASASARPSKVHRPSRSRTSHAVPGVTKTRTNFRRVNSPHDSSLQPTTNASSTKPAGVTSLPGLIGKYIPLPLPVPDWSKPIILALLLLCIGFGLRARAISRRARRLEETGLALVADIGTMQAALVPKIPDQIGGLAISVAYRPADGPAAGGDFYDVFELDDGVTVVILGDVSGHGRLALAHAARMRYTLRAYAEAGLAPRDVLKLAGNAIGTSGDGLYTTVVVAVHHARAASLTYASAGHPPPLFLGPGAHEPLTVCASPPLGWGVPTGRRQTTISFPDGARACLLSDGLIEARAKHELLGRERVAQMFARLGSRPSASMLLDHVRDFAPQVCDDMAACIIEAADAFGGPVNEARLEELELDMDQLDHGHAHRFLTACELSEAEVAAAVRRTREIVADHGTGVLAVTLPDRSWSVSRPSRPVIGPTTMPPLRRVSLTPGGIPRPQRSRILATESSGVAS